MIQWRKLKKKKQILVFNGNSFDILKIKTKHEKQCLIKLTVNS